jgi:hypothetical protein
MSGKSRKYGNLLFIEINNTIFNSNAVAGKFSSTIPVSFVKRFNILPVIEYTFEHQYNILF